MKYFLPPYTSTHIERQYRELAKVLHPDKGGSDEHFKEMQKEKEIALKVGGVHKALPVAKLSGKRKRIKMKKRVPPRVNIIIDPDKFFKTLKKYIR